MLYRFFIHRHNSPRLRPWMLVFLLLLLLGLAYLVLRTPPMREAPVPSPNFKRERGGGAVGGAIW